MTFLRLGTESPPVQPPPPNTIKFHNSLPNANVYLNVKKQRLWLLSKKTEIFKYLSDMVGVRTRVLCDFRFANICSNYKDLSFCRFNSKKKWVKGETDLVWVKDHLKPLKPHHEKHCFILRITMPKIACYGGRHIIAWLSGSHICILVHRP